MMATNLVQIDNDREIKQRLEACLLYTSRCV